MLAPAALAVADVAAELGDAARLDGVHDLETAGVEAPLPALAAGTDRGARRSAPAPLRLHVTGKVPKKVRRPTEAPLDYFEAPVEARPRSGEKAIALIGVANRNPAVFDNPDAPSWPLRRAASLAEKSSMH